jgi:hypothetical protein
MVQNQTKEKAVIESMDRMPIKTESGAIEWGWVVRWRAPNGNVHATEITGDRPTKEEIEEAVRNDLKYITAQIGREITV